MLLTIFVFLVVLSVLVLVHELGHFLVAKKTSIKVEEFGLGYPPKIWDKKIGETLYSINLIPFGGFVRLFGQDEIDEKRKKGAFWAKSKKVRLAVIWSGVFANIFLSFFLFWLIYLIIGIPIKTDKVIIEAVVIDSPAAEVGIKPKDVVVGLDGERVASVEEFIAGVEAKRGEKVRLSLERKGEGLEKELVPRQETPEEEGPLGVVISSYEMKRFPFWQMPFLALVEGVKESYGWLVMIVSALFKMLGDLIFRGLVPRDIAGPLGIFQVTSYVAKSGLVAVLQFVGILSINLAVINIFPFPALDGGRFLFLIIEAVTGRRSPEQVERWVHNLGMAFLLFLMLLVTINDAKRILTSTDFGAHLQSLWPF